MHEAGCTQEEINDAHDHYDSRGQTAYDQRSPDRLPPPLQDNYEGEYDEDDFTDAEGQPSTFDERESSRADYQQHSKGIRSRRPSIEEQAGQPASVNLYNATIHTFNAQAPPMTTAIPTISEDLTATTDSATRPTESTQCELLRVWQRALHNESLLSPDGHHWPQQLQSALRQRVKYG
eukprot:2581135-Amphidinium_carterae.1